MSAQLAPGRTLGRRYHLDALIARGGMAEVWSATDQVLGRSVAVKVLLPHLADDEVLRARFRNEAIAAARLVHPSIVAIFDTCEEDDGTEAIVMELVRGRTLRDFLDERGHLEPIEVVHIGAEVASALASAHRAGIVHRDVKPANILLSDDGRVLVTDFGIAKVLDEADVTRTSMVLGTVKYLAPEQVTGAPVDARTDVYSLGAVLYECLTGAPPFEADNPTALALARLQHDPEPVARRRPGVPAALDHAVSRAMGREPDHRFRSADDLRAALLATRLDQAADLTVAAADGWPSATVPVPPRPTPPTGEPVGGSGPAPRRPTTSVVVALLVVAALVVTALLVASTGVGRDLFSDDPTTSGGGGGPSSGTPIPIVAVTSFDPDGSGPSGENEELAANVADGDPSTEWRTEGYASQDFGRLKAGVGLVLDLGEVHELERIRITSPTPGWSVEVFVAESAPPTREGWLEPVDSATGIDGPVELDLDGARGSKVLVWITDLGPSGEHRVTISDISVVG